ncbi:hypothetical protein H5T52_02360 [Candidatus Bipolaricaulota bacterium]|nr:hypothetical protein [Candidatus Bipolaricaulota bacterium]
MGKKLALWAALAVGIAAGLAFGFRGLLRELVVAPLVRLWWLMDSLPQGLVWLVAVAVGALAGLRALGSMPRAERPRPQEPRPPDSQLIELVRLIRRAEYSPAARRELARRLARTAVGIRARREGVPPRQAWADLRAGRWPQEEELLLVLVPPRFPWPARTGQNYLESLSRAVELLSLKARGGIREAR